ncbi:MAG: SMI1/KNR4 family protein [Deinococcota bacterium]
MAVTWIENLVTNLHTWDYLGHDEKDGQVIIGYPKAHRNQAVGPFMHIHFAGLTDEEISDVEAKYELTLPQDLKDLYTFSNGLGMFNKWVTIYGTELSRMPDKNFIHNLDEVNIIAEARGQKEKHQFIIGQRGAYNAYLYLDTKTNLIHHATSEEDLKPQFTWQHLSSLLTSEYGRLSALYDEAGHRTFFYEGELESKAHSQKSIKRIDIFMAKYTIEADDLTDEWQRIHGLYPFELIPEFEADPLYQDHTIRMELVEVDIPEGKRRGGKPDKEPFLVVKPHLNVEQLEHWEGILERVEMELRTESD